MAAIADERVTHDGDAMPAVLALRHWAEQTPSAPALLAPGWPARDYRGLASDVEGLAAEIAALGLGRRDPVAIVLPDGPALATLLLAAMWTAAAAPLPWGMTGAEYARSLSGGFARVVVAPENPPSVIRSTAALAGVPLLELHASPGANGARFILRGEPVGSAMRPSEPRSGDTALILSSSGTTGEPKRIPRTHAAASITARAMMRAKAVSRDDRLLGLAPMAFSLGLNALLMSIAAGASVVALPGVNLAALPALVAAYRPTWLSTAPAALLAMAADDAVSTAMRGCGLRMVNAGAAGITPDEIAAIEHAFGAPLIHDYGLSEAPFVAGERFASPWRKPGSAGVPTHEVAIVDGDLTPLARGETGEIVTRGPNVFAGYIGDPEATAAAFLPDGWFRTGDLGRLDDDGTLFVTGRLREMINRGGLVIAPGEVEQALLADPAVGEACVFAIPHPVLGEDVAAVVVLRPGAVATERTLRARVANALSPAKIPRTIAFTTRIPRGPTGKPLRRELAASICAERRLDTEARSET